MQDLLPSMVSQQRFVIPCFIVAHFLSALLTMLYIAAAETV